MSVDLSFLEPLFLDKVNQLLAESKAAGLDCRPTCGMRSLEDQARLWRRSRTSLQVTSELIDLRTAGCDYLADILKGVGPQPMGDWATNAIPGLSWHNWGEALDCLLFRDSQLIKNGDDPQYALFGSIARNIGLRWGGDFTGTSKDAGHVQLRLTEIPDTYPMSQVNLHFLTLSGTPSAALEAPSS